MLCGGTASMTGFEDRFQREANLSASAIRPTLVKAPEYMPEDLARHWRGWAARSWPRWSSPRTSTSPRATTTRPARPSSTRSASDRERTAGAYVRSDQQSSTACRGRRHWHWCGVVSFLVLCWASLRERERERGAIHGLWLWFRRVVAT
ncbi:hypothetical protein ZWY2020_054904 [Hordeum vulgare]|nr:hypothetical protein ZWY2020_054904 [Hordeum vulgare]